LNYHVVIVGAGPGGCVLARELAREGIPVTIYEKGSFSQLGHDWSDLVEIEPLAAAGFEIPELEGNRWVGTLVKKETEDEGLFEPHAIPRLKLYSPDYQAVKEIKTGMITTDRRKLGQELVEQARQAGAQIYYHREGMQLLYREKGNSLEDLEVYGVTVKDGEKGECREVHADLVVESSGYYSILRKSLPAHLDLARHFPNSEFAMVHREVRLRDREKAKNDPLPDHYRYGYHSGYQWSHVHTPGKIDIGAGVRYAFNQPDPRDIIEEYISRHPSIMAYRVRGGRSPCIVGKPLDNFVAPGFLVLGDAASTSIPTTGCGTGSALMAGLWASRVIAEAAREGRNDLGKLWDFNRKFYRDGSRGAHLAALSAVRPMLQSLNHDSLNHLYRIGLLEGGELEKSINGEFMAPPLLQKLPSIFRGLSRPYLLRTMGRVLSLAGQIYRHYSRYPAEWEAGSFSQWKTEAEKLFSRVYD